MRVLICFVLWGLVLCGSVCATSQKSEKLVTIIGLQQFVSGWNRNFNLYANKLESARGFIYEPLVIYNGMNNKEIPWLAEKVVLKPDLETIIIHVRKGVKWSDGKDFTADDVVFNFTYPKDHPEIDFRGLWRNDEKLKSVTKIDDYTVEIVLSERNAFAKSTLLNEFFMIPKHRWEGVDKPTHNIVENPIGTGPLTEVVSFTPQLYIMGRNPFYWQADKLKIDRFAWPQLNSNDVAYEMLASGDIDWAHIFIPDIERVYVAGDKHKKYWFPSDVGVRIAMNMQTRNHDNQKAFSNLYFRRAFSLAMNREKMMEIGAYGYVKGGNPATGLPPLLWHWRNPRADLIWSKYNRFDIVMAKKELADGGFEDIDCDGFIDNYDGSPIKFSIQVPSGWTDWVTNCQIAVEGLREIGINASMETPEVTSYVDNWATGNFDAQFCGNNSLPTVYKFYEVTMTEPYFYTNIWWSSNLTKDMNPERDAYIQELKITYEESNQKKIVDRIEMMYAKTIPHIPLYYNGKWFVYNTSRITGWANENNPYIEPCLADHDNKLYHLLNLRPVK